MAELLVLETVERYGLNACVVCPTRVFGPGILTESNSVTKIMADYLRGKWWIMPGDGSAIGNYVCVHDVVHGLIQALKLGHAGQRYILGGENLSYRQWFALLAQHSGVQRSLIPLPYPIAAAYAQFHLLLASLFGIPPQLTPAFARKYYLDSRFDCSQTRLDLHYKPARIADAIDATIHWLRENEAS